MLQTENKIQDSNQRDDIYLPIPAGAQTEREKEGEGGRGQTQGSK